MPDQDTMSISAVMDRVLSDIKRTDRIFGLFHSPLLDVADGVGRLDKRIDKLEAKVDRRFDEVDRRFDEVDRRFDEVDKKFSKLGAELGVVSDSVNVLVARFEEIGKYIEQDERKVDQIEK